MRTTTSKFEDGRLTVYIERDVDHHVAKQIRQEIDETIRRAAPQVVTLDFSAVEFMDSAGIGLIMGRHKLAQTAGAELKIGGLNERCRRIIEMSGLSDIVEICR